jgi:hypothetical protein
MEVCGAGSREPGAPTCHPDAHGVGRQEPNLKKCRRRFFNLQDLQEDNFCVKRMLLEVCGAGSREPLHVTLTPTG